MRCLWCRPGNTNGFPLDGQSYRPGWATANPPFTMLDCYASWRNVRTTPVLWCVVGGASSATRLRGAKPEQQPRHSPCQGLRPPTEKSRHFPNPKKVILAIYVCINIATCVNCSLEHNSWTISVQQLLHAIIVVRDPSLGQSPPTHRICTWPNYSLTILYLLIICYINRTPNPSHHAHRLILRTQFTIKETSCHLSKKRF